LAGIWRRYAGGGPTHIVTLNPEMVMAARRNPQVFDLIRRADLFVADGVGITWAAKQLTRSRVQRYPGIDLAWDLMSRLAAKQASVFLVGARPGVADRAAGNLTSQLPGLNIAGVVDGYFGPEDESAVVANICRVKPDLLLVGMGSPKQEGFISSNRDELGIPLMIGVGGALEVFAGEKQRAPKFIQRSGLEWSYRALKDLSRLKRIGVLPRFVALVLKEALMGGAA